MKLRLLILGLSTAGAAAVLAGAALADPPGRVGRISFVEGDVSFQPPEQDVWTDATVNFPVAPGEAFWTGDAGRTELQVGAVDARLDSQTEVDVVALRYGEMRLALPQGSLNLQLHGSPAGGVTVSTPAGDVHILQAGFYRVDVGAPQEDGSYPPAEVTVFEGAAEAPGPQGFTPVGPREAAVLYAGAEPELQDAQDTAIDDWSRGRARLEQRMVRDDLPAAMTGAAGLGRYGEFTSSPDYGAVWFPRDVPADWAPYRYGHWAYVAPWGYTWIDEQPWGFAPFHYGRWARIDGRWGWIPGQPTAEPVYAPALVAFIGGAGWSASLNLGGGEALGWAPLAPDEVYRPPYEVSDAYVRRVNVTNVNTRIIENITVNRTVDNYRNASAVTVVRADAFSRGVPVQRAVVPVSAEAIARAPAAKPAVAAPPTAQARTGVAGREGATPEVKTAAPPPARLRAVRAAVAAPTAAASKPPVIAGETLAPPRPRRARAAPAEGLIAPAQVKNPAAQNRQPATPAAAGAPAAATPATAPTPTDAQVQARAQRRARQEAARKAAAGATPPTAPTTTAPPATPSTAAPPPDQAQAQAQAPVDAKARAEARRKARLEAAQKAAAGTTPAPAPATTAHPPSSPANAASTPDQAQADAKAKAQARRKARQEAAQKAAAAAASPAPPPN